MKTEDLHEYIKNFGEFSPMELDIIEHMSEENNNYIFIPENMVIADNDTINDSVDEKIIKFYF